ncbi:M48 family metalloprotease [Halocynthiibacter namhaensis]|uniref:M48 family metalloprotease n=1 Tax=Halocynthiibacter namhaensis TaxID=1290553 RepID=UPI000691B37F|nr:M48 family metalloprotease [Halocynthiibacter namhaensis]
MTVISFVRKHLTRPLQLLCVAGLMTLPSQNANAQNLIRDAELEHSLTQLATPILNAAGLSPARVKIIILNDRSLNAFIIDTRHIFIHSGLITRMEDPSMLQAVIAHEAAHIANGHISRRLANMRSSRTAAGFGLLLSAVVAAAGSPEAASGIALGSAGSAQRVLFAHTRGEESSADQSGARFMANAGVDPEAMVRVLDLLHGQEVLSAGRQDPYARTHPLSADRRRQVRGYAAAYSGGNDITPAAQYWFDRSRAKLSSFTGNSRQTLRRLRNLRGSDVTETVLLQRAIALHRQANTRKAIANIDALITARPNDPYYHELKGQILLESRDPAGAVRSYRRAADILPNQPLILAGYGRSLLAADTRSSLASAKTVLERSYAHDPRQPRMLRDLALVYSKTGNPGLASLVTAERFALTGNMRNAKIHAQRAADQLPRGSQGWNRAQDVLRTTQ